MSDNVKKHWKNMFQHCRSIPGDLKALKNRFISHFDCVSVIALGHVL